MLNKTQMHDQIERYRKQMEDTAAALDMLREQDTQLEAKIDANSQRIQTLRRDVDQTKRELDNFKTVYFNQQEELAQDYQNLLRDQETFFAPWRRLASGTFGDRMKFFFTGALPTQEPR